MLLQTLKLISVSTLHISESSTAKMAELLGMIVWKPADYLNQSFQN